MDNETIVEPPKRKSLRLLLLVVVPVVVLLVIAVFYLIGGRYVSTDNAYVKADKVPISTTVAGAVKEVLVTENQAVAAGQPLFRLDSEPFELAVAKAQAKLAQVKSNLAGLKASYRGKEAQIALTQTQRGFALKNQKRQASLIATGATSAMDLDAAKETAEVAAKQSNVLTQDLKQIAENLGGSINAPAEEAPAYRAAVAELEQAQFDLAHIEVRAPQAGVVSKPPKVGQYVGVGATAMALVGSDEVWVEANLTEADLTYIHAGETVKIRIDTFPDKTWQGEVDSLSPATGSEFSVIPAQNATGNWVKIAQRVPVRIKLQTSSDLPTLRAGLSANIEIDTHHKRRFLGLSL